jgi:hypothetical protein
VIARFGTRTGVLERPHGHASIARRVRITTSLAGRDEDEDGENDQLVRAVPHRHAGDRDAEALCDRLAEVERARVR